MSSAQEKQAYHHGDLKRSLIQAGLDLVREVGIETISLRQLAERVGVSTPALYHHFRNKEALLGQLGEAAIDAFDEAMASAMLHQTEDDALSAFVLGYVRFARDEPALYELLFGRRIWSSSEAADFQRKARHSFRVQSERLLQLQQLGVLPPSANPLRLAQVAWATLHGLCCMYNDGLAFTAEAIEDIAKHAIQLLRQAVMGMPGVHAH